MTGGRKSGSGGGTSPLGRLARLLGLSAAPRSQAEIPGDEIQRIAASGLFDAAFYAANTLVSDRFLLTTSFNLHFTKPVKVGEVVAEGRWISGKRRVFVAESRLVDAEGDEIGRGTGTFMRSHIALSGLPGYSGARD